MLPSLEHSLGLDFAALVVLSVARWLVVVAVLLLLMQNGRCCKLEGGSRFLPNSSQTLQNKHQQVLDEGFKLKDFELQSLSMCGKFQ